MTASLASSAATATSCLPENWWYRLIEVWEIGPDQRIFQTIGVDMAAIRSLPRRAPLAWDAARLVSVSSLVGRVVQGDDGGRIGRVVDCTVRLGDTHPPLVGLVVRVGYRRIFIHIQNVSSLSGEAVVLSSERVDLAEFQRRDGEVLLMGDVVDRQVVDVDGVQVIRCSDAFLGLAADGWRLVGADVSLATVWHRLVAPHRRVPPRRVLDWATIVTFTPGHRVHVDRSRSQLPRLRPAELADLLEDLTGAQREDLLDSLTPEAGADAVEEMEADRVRDLLTSVSHHRAVQLLQDMEPDEAVDALRDLDQTTRNDFMNHMAHDHRTELSRLLDHAPRTAGALMNPRLVSVTDDTAVSSVRAMLADYLHEHGTNLSFVVVVDAAGRLLDDVTTLEIAVADEHIPIRELMREPWPITVTTDTDFADVVSNLRDNRAAWLLVVDDQERPVGRIEADDVIDALIDNNTTSGLLWKDDPA